MGIVNWFFILAILSWEIFLSMSFYPHVVFKCLALYHLEAGKLLLVTAGSILRVSSQVNVDATGNSVSLASSFHFNHLPKWYIECDYNDLCGLLILICIYNKRSHRLHFDFDKWPDSKKCPLSWPWNDNFTKLIQNDVDILVSPR